MNKNDLRFKKTEKLIIETFLQLIDEIGFENTFVTTICERAMINRKTFYLHYIDRYDLLNHIYSQLKDVMIESLSQQAILDLKNLNLYESVKWCITEANKHRDLLRILLKSSTKEFRDILIDIFSKYPARQIVKNFDEVANNIEYEIISVYMCDAMIGFFDVWFNNYNALTLNEAINLMYELVNQPAKIYMIKLLSDPKTVLIDSNLEIKSIFAR